MNKPLSRADIQAAKAQNTDKRDRDLAESLGISEVELLAADIGNGVTRIDAQVDGDFQGLVELGLGVFLGQKGVDLGRLGFSGKAAGKRHNERKF